MTTTEGASSAREHAACDPSARAGSVSRRALVSCQARVSCQAMGIAMAGGVMLLSAAPAFAQEPISTPAPVSAQSASTAQVYAPDFFVRFAPKTALDMVSNVPGFSIKSEGEERGFGQASENVLINGRRISGKTNGAEAALERIGADAVTRIEIVDGASLDIPGLSGQVANVIADLDKVGGSWFWQPQFREYRFPAWANGGGSVNGRTGAFSWSLGLRSNENNNGHDGPEYITNASGVLIEQRDEDYNGEVQEPSIDATVTYESVAGSVANLNVSLGLFNARGQERSKQYPVGGAPRLVLGDFGDDNREYEIGADYDFAFGPGRLKLIGLQRMNRGAENDAVVQYQASLAPKGVSFRTDYEAGESIVRGEYGLGLFGGDVQLAMEGAFNSYEQAALFGELQTAGQASGQYLYAPEDRADARVEEQRAEANLSYSRPLGKSWSLQSSLGVEYSQLDVSYQGYTAAGAPLTPDGKTRDFVRPKGFLALVWKVDPASDISFKLERKVGQLDFGDFLASVNVSDDTSTANNPDLVPDQMWLGSIEANRNLGPWGGVKAVLQAAAIEDIVDQVPIGTGSDQGVGNIDTASAFSVEFSGTLKLDPLGWKGAQLEFRSLFAGSEVDDPLTGEPRMISGNDVFEGFAELRWDIPTTPWATGLGIEDERDAAIQRLDQRLQFWNDPATIFAYVENKDVFGLKARLSVVNLTDTSENLKREVYDYRGPGQPRPVVRTEERFRPFGPIVRFNLSGSF